MREFLTLPEGSVVPAEQVPNTLSDISRHTNEVREGKTNNVGGFTLLAGTTKIQVMDRLVNQDSYIGLMAMDNIAADLKTFIIPETDRFTVYASALYLAWAMMTRTTDADYTSSPGSPTKIVNYTSTKESTLYPAEFTADIVNGTIVNTNAGELRFVIVLSFDGAQNTDYRIWLARNGSFLPADSISVTVGGKFEEPTNVVDAGIQTAAALDSWALYIENLNGGTDTVHRAYIQIDQTETAGTPTPEDANAEFRYVVVG